MPEPEDKASKPKEPTEAETRDEKSGQPRDPKYAVPPPKIGPLWTVANFFFRQIYSIEPRKVTSYFYPGEYSPDPQKVDRERGTAPACVKYKVKEVLMQPTVHSCEATVAMMILKFHRENLDHLLNSPDSPCVIEEKTKAFLKAAHARLEARAKTVEYETFRLLDESELEKLYSMTTVPLWKNKAEKPPEQLAEELAFQLYRYGPLSIAIRTRSYNLTLHAVMVTGVVNQHVMFLDPWNGKENCMNIADFAKQVDYEDIQVGAIRAPGYSHELRHNLAKVETAKKAEAAKGDQAGETPGAKDEAGENPSPKGGYSPRSSGG